MSIFVQIDDKGLSKYTCICDGLEIIPGNLKTIFTFFIHIFFLPVYCHGLLWREGVDDEIVDEESD
jgi:hypothetical protein